MKNIQVGPFERLEMRTSGDIADELFSSLEYLTEIEEVGRKFLQRRGHTLNILSTVRQMQAFIRQAKTFFKSAETLHYRASPLIYYYSFLNLVKAYLSITDPQAVKKNVYHGLTVPTGPRNVNNKILQTNNGLFPLFYERVIGEKIPRYTRFKFNDLLGYCTDIALEYRQGGFGEHRACLGKISVANAHDTGDAYVLLGIWGFQKIEPYKKLLSLFNRNFEEVELNYEIGRSIFNMYAEEQDIHRFFESRRAFPQDQDGRSPLGEMVFYSHDALEPFFEPINYLEDGDYWLVAPLRKNLQLRMRESIAIYAAMFYLGSLVRYNPTLLEHMLESREAWIIERFAKTAPITFLRRMRNLIHGRNFIYLTR